MAKGQKHSNREIRKPTGMPIATRRVSSGNRRNERPRAKAGCTTIIQPSAEAGGE